MFTATLLFALASSVVAQSQSAASVGVSAVASAVAGPSLSASSALAPVPSAAQSASASGAPVLSNTTYAFDCPAGYSLTYAITNATYTGVDLMTAVGFFSNWTGAAPGMTTASDATAGTRTYMPMGANFTISEILTNSTTDPATGALHQTFNSTAPISIMGIEVASTFSDLQVYTSDTTMATTLQYFTNVCVGPGGQEAALAALPALLTGATTYWASQLTGAVQSGSMSMSMSATGLPAAGVVPSASSALSSATAAPSNFFSSALGSVSSLTGAPAAALSSLTGSPAGAITSLAGGLLPTPSLRARGRWL